MAFLKDFTKTIAQHPVSRTASLTALGAGAGYLGSKALGKLLARLLYANRSPEELQRMEQEFDESRLKKVGTVLGAAAGVFLAQGGTIDTQNGLKNAFNSAVNPNYWQENPDLLKAKVDARKAQGLNALERTLFFPQWAGLPKQAYGSSSFITPSISIYDSLSLIQKDRFLKTYEKNELSSILNSAAPSKPQGLISQKQLMGTALNMGGAFVPAYMFGRGVGALLGLPKPTATRLSTIGGLAAAIKNSGIIGA
jgi:hypothetical protein